MRNPILSPHQAELEALCKRYHVRRLEVFGSAVREDFDPQHSDLDLLVEIDPESRPALKKAGLLTRDSRKKESKKYGLKKARKAPQFTKR